jgi:predicted DNA-binding transcriptional regulator YafY
MMDIIMKTLQIAYRDSLPVRIIYEGRDGMTQRVIVIKSIKEEGVVAYCRLRRRISTFKSEHILAAELVTADR